MNRFSVTTTFLNKTCNDFWAIRPYCKTNFSFGFEAPSVVHTVFLLNFQNRFDCCLFGVIEENAFVFFSNDVHFHLSGCVN